MTAYSLSPTHIPPPVAHISSSPSTAISLIGREVLLHDNGRWQAAVVLSFTHGLHRIITQTCSRVGTCVLAESTHEQLWMLRPAKKAKGNGYDLVGAVVTYERTGDVQVMECVGMVFRCLEEGKVLGVALLDRDEVQTVPREKVCVVRESPCLERESPRGIGHFGF